MSSFKCQGESDFDLKSLPPTEVVFICLFVGPDLNSNDLEKHRQHYTLQPVKYSATWACPQDL